jgi:antitoxin (DNA-binding transcriptional repressor) of toxin-antitoxin stability system
MPAIRVAPQELSARWEELIALANAGTEILVTEGDAPCARIVPLVVGQARVPGLHPGAFVVADDFDAPLPADFWTDEA